MDAILRKERTGAPWRDLPERYGPWKTGARTAAEMDRGRHVGPGPGTCDRQRRLPRHTAGQGRVRGQRRLHQRPGPPARRGGCRRR
ncbi:transposase [Actinokineospora sp. G85]|uniref:transposase n=1 Tax=Actinokineospora sp. G85 TaxID=3406626 RepID=UPI003C78714E